LTKLTISQDRPWPWGELIGWSRGIVI